MRYQGLCEGTYAGKSLTPAGDRCKNLYPETLNGAGSPEAQKVLLNTPGTLPWLSFPTAKIDYIYNEPSTGRLFVITNNKLYMVQSFDNMDVSTPISSLIGTVGLGPYKMSSNGTQMMLSCAGDLTGWIIGLTAFNLDKITATGFFGTMDNCCIDNYFISTVGDRRFQISNLTDARLWSALDYAVASGGSERISALLADHGELWIFGNRHVEVYQDTGNASFPFERIKSIYIPHGIAAYQGAISLDNAVYWIGMDEQGQCRVFRADGYVARGVSNRSVEYFFNLYAQNYTLGVADANMYGYQNETGHTFLVINFPTATVDLAPNGTVTSNVVSGAQWVYDITENEWHERSRIDSGTGKESLPMARYHAFHMGKHIVGGGDVTQNSLFKLREDVYTENGNITKRVRRAPHIVNGLKWINYSYLRLSAQVGAIPTGSTDDKISLRVSNDGGMTWSNYYQKSLGFWGNYKAEICWRRLGRAKRRAFELSTSVIAPVCIIDADLGVDGEQ